MPHSEMMGNTMYERFTNRARQALQSAAESACRLHHEYIGTEHLLLGLLQQEECVANVVLKNLEFDGETLRNDMADMNPPRAESRATGVLPKTPRCKKSLEYAMELARELGHRYVGTEHLLLGLLREGGVAADALRYQGVTLELTRDEVEKVLGRNATPNKSRLTQALTEREVSIKAGEFTSRANQAIESARKLAASFRHSGVGPGHLLLGLLSDSDGIVSLALSNLGLPPADLREEIELIIRGESDEEFT